MSELIERLRADLGERYVVERQLGAGGMAQVFLAQDRKHDRRVAIKVLRAELAASLGADRFLREIAIAARLQHPHILPLYDSGSADGLLYYVMPFVEGESLANRIARETRLPVADAYRIASEVVGALDYAHRQGIVHRDIKPANILLSEGHAVVADFGIARAVSAAGGEGITLVGLAVGTPAYMSPEQATGSTDEIDGRSDIYSLGAVLFEMLAGDVPFSGPSFQAILAKALTGEVPAISERRPDAPPDVDACLRRAMAKDPADRFATGADFAEALTRPLDALYPRRPWWRRYAPHAAVVVLAAALALSWVLRPSGLQSAVASDAQVIAVLPFRATGTGVEVLGEGMVDLLSTNLNGVGGVRTVDPGTVLHHWHRRAEGGALDLDGSLAVGREVDAGAILTGSVLALPAGVRLNATLRSVLGSELAAVVVEGPADSLLALVDTLSLRIMRDIWRSREPVPDFRVSAITTGSLTAIRAYLEGEQHYRRNQWDSAIVAFTRAVEADSTFAVAHLRLGTTYGWTEGHGAANSRRHTEVAARYAERLPARERFLVDVSQLFERGDLAAVDSMRSYVKRYPDDAEGWYMLGEAQYHAQPLLALPPESLYAPFDRALALDPSLSPAVIHPLELGMIFPDSARYWRYFELLMATPGASETKPFESLGGIAFRGDALHADDVRHVAIEQPLALPLLYAVAFQRGGPVVDSLLAGLDVVVHTEPRRRSQVLSQRASFMLGSVRIEGAAALLDSLWESAPASAAVISLLTGLNGLPNWPHTERAMEELRRVFAEAPDQLWFFEMLYALGHEDLPAAREVLGRLDTTSMNPRLLALTGALRGWYRILEGDTATGVAAMRAGLDGGGFGANLGYQAAALRYQLAATLAARPPTREEAIRRLQNDWYLKGFSPFVYLTLARAQEAAGDAAGAMTSYSRFLDLWERADPELQVYVADARRALERLAATTG